jgi:TRAP-type C4-dicarboxylate transport system permease small subunit
MIGIPMSVIYFSFPFTMFFMIFWNVVDLLKLRPGKTESPAGRGEPKKGGA